VMRWILITGEILRSVTECSTYMYGVVCGREIIFWRSGFIDGERCVAHALRGHYFPARAQLAFRVWGDDLDLFVAEFHMARLDFGLEGFALAQEALEDFGFGDGGDFLALDIDDALAVASEDGDVRALGFAGAVDDTAHHGDLHGDDDLFLEFVVDLLDEVEEVDLDAATGGAGDEFGTDAFSFAEGVEEFEAVLDLVDGVVGVGDSDGVADAVGQEGAECDDRADGAGFLWACVGDAEVQGVGEAFTDFGVGVDDELGIHGLCADGDVVEVTLVEDVEVFFEFGDHDGDHVAVLVVGEDGPEFFGAGLFVLAFDDGALVDTDADWDASSTIGLFAGVDDFFDLFAVGDVAGVEADFVYACFDGFEGAFEMEVDIGDDGDGGLGEDIFEGLGVFFLWDGDPHDVGTGGGEFVDLGDAFVDVVGVAGGHGLDGDRGGGGGF